MLHEGSRSGVVITTKACCARSTSRTTSVGTRRSGHAYPPTHA